MAEELVFVGGYEARYRGAQVGWDEREEPSVDGSAGPAHAGHDIDDGDRDRDERG